MHKVTEILNLPNMKVYKVVIFYTMFNHRPMGKYHVQICIYTLCWLRNSNSVMKTFCELIQCEVGGNLADNMLSVSEVECLLKLERHS